MRHPAIAVAVTVAALAAAPASALTVERPRVTPLQAHEAIHATFDRFAGSMPAGRLLIGRCAPHARTWQACRVTVASGRTRLRFVVRVSADRASYFLSSQIIER